MHLSKTVTYGRLAVACTFLCMLVTPGLARTKIGVLFKDKLPGFWTFAEKGAMEAGAALDVDVIVRAPPSVLDVSSQARLLNGLVAENIDALVIASTNPETVESIVSDLAQKGVKIVTVDTPLKDGLAQVFVGADQVAVAEAATKLFLSIAQDGEEVAMLRNNSLDRTVLTREETFREGLKARPNLTLHANIFASSERNSEGDQATLLLNKFPKTAVVFASASRGTMAMIKAVRDSGLTGKVKVVGFGTYFPEEAVKAFDEGILYGFVAQEPKSLGATAVKSAVALLAGKSVPPFVRPDFMVITRENFKSSEAQALINP